MPTQSTFFFGNGEITSSATAVSVLSLIIADGYTPKGGCVSLNVTCSTNTYWGNASTVTNTDGALVTANTPFTDSGTGLTGNVIPINEMFIYNNSGGASAVVIFARFTP